MKQTKMERQVVATCLAMFIIGVVINGIYSVVSMNSSSFTYEVLANGVGIYSVVSMNSVFLTYDVLASGVMSVAAYMLFLYTNVRLRETIAFPFGIVGATFFLYLGMEVVGTFDPFNDWRSIALIILSLGCDVLSAIQSEAIREKIWIGSTTLSINGEEIDDENIEIISI